MAKRHLHFKTLTGSVILAGEEFSDEVELDDASPELVRAAGSAHAAGVIDVLDGLDDSHVEPDEVSLEKLEEAKGEWVEPTWNEDGTREPGYWTGPWYEGHIRQAQADREAFETGDVADLADVVRGGEEQ